MAIIAIKRPNGKDAKVSSAISEQLRMPEKEVGMQAGFLTSWPVATGGAIFRQVCYE
jgi:hypothetical protein